MAHQSQLASVVGEILEHHLSFKLNAHECHALANKFGIGPMSTAFLQEPEALAMTLTNTSLSCQPLVAIFAAEAGKRTAAEIMGHVFTPEPLKLEPLAQSWHCPLTCDEAFVGTDYSRGDDSGFSNTWTQLSSSDDVVASGGDVSSTYADTNGISTATFAEAQQALAATALDGAAVTGLPQQAEVYNSIPDDITTEPDSTGVISWQHRYNTPWAEGFAEYLADSYTLKAKSEVLAGDAFIGKENSAETEPEPEAKAEASAAQGEEVVKDESAAQVKTEADLAPAVKVKLPHGARRKIRAEKKAAKKAARRAALLKMQAKQRAQQQGVGLTVGQSAADDNKTQPEPQPAPVVKPETVAKPAPVVPEQAAERVTPEVGTKPAVSSTSGDETAPQSSVANLNGSKSASEASTTEASPKPAATATPQQGTAANIASSTSAQGEDSASEAEVAMEAANTATTPPHSSADKDSAADSKQTETSKAKQNTAAKSNGKGKGKSTKQPRAATSEDAPPREAVLLLGWMLFVLTQGKSALVGMHNVLLLILKTFGVVALEDLKQVAGRKRVSFSKSLQLLEDVGKVALVDNKVVWLAPPADFNPLSQPLYPLEEKRKNGLKGKDRLLTNVLSVGSLNDGLMSQTAGTVLAAMQQYKAVNGEQLRLLLGLKKRNFARAVSFLVRLEVLLDHKGNLYLLPSSKVKPQTLMKRYEKQQQSTVAQGKHSTAKQAASKAAATGSSGRRPVKAAGDKTPSARMQSSAPAKSKAPAKNSALAETTVPATDAAILQPEMSAAYAARSYAATPQLIPASADRAAEHAEQHTPVQTSLVSHLDANTVQCDLYEGSRSSTSLALFAGSAADASSATTTNAEQSHSVGHDRHQEGDCPQGKEHPQGEA